jgi:hypothetical protein
MLISPLYDMNLTVIEIKKKNSLKNKNNLPFIFSIKKND